MGNAGRVAFFVLIVLVVGATAGWCEETRADKPAFDPGTERIGPLRLGLPAAKVVSSVTCPVQKGRERHEAATGEYVQTWTMPACGLELKMGAAKRGGAQSVDAITVTAPSQLTTSKGIGVGSTEAEVQTAYGEVQDAEGTSEPGRLFVAGSIFGGLMIEFDQGRVKSLFLGAAAE